jgi:Fe-S cluster assembly iron-binding protein IscA
MFQITDSAARTLKTTLSNVSDVERPRFRLGFVDGSVRLAVDQERPGDTTVEHKGEALIVMDPSTSHKLSGLELDYDEDGSQLVLK